MFWSTASYYCHYYYFMWLLFDISFYFSVKLIMKLKGYLIQFCTELKKEIKWIEEKNENSLIIWIFLWISVLFAGRNKMSQQCLKEFGKVHQRENGKGVWRGRPYRLQTAGRVSSSHCKRRHWAQVTAPQRAVALNWILAEEAGRMQREVWALILCSTSRSTQTCRLDFLPMLLCVHLQQLFLFLEH